MNYEDQVKIIFETFIFCKDNNAGEALDKCKSGNEYFFIHKTGLKTTCSMILKMEKFMYKSLPIASNSRHDEQFDRMNRLLGECKMHLKNIENGSHI